MALLIAIEGIDGSGKGTQAALLKEHLQRQGQRVCLLSFPRYQDTRFGTAIGEFLNGRFGALDAVHPQLAALLFAGDRFESKDLILQAVAENDVVLFDRYVASNIAHQAAKLGEDERLPFIDWIEAIEYDVYGLPRADLTVLLDLPASAAARLIAAKSKRTYTSKAADLQEADTGYLSRVRDVYRGLAVQNARWSTIECLSGDAVRSVESITYELQSLVDMRSRQRHNRDPSKR
ncbi:MAG: dTMP kinase [Planctomycetaceae bacterium]|nr:dTMP kinase [Planctomycetaceae bacterium]